MPPCVQENFRFYAATLAGQQELAPRWKRCTQSTDRALGECCWSGLGGEELSSRRERQYGKARQGPSEVALDKDIQQLDWMSDATKAEAKKKLDAFRDKIGYPRSGETTLP